MRLLLAILALFTVQACANPEQVPSNATVVSVAPPSFEYTIDSLRTHGNDTLVEIAYDNFFGKSMTFRGFSLNEVIKRIGWDQYQDHTVHFNCDDGYVVSVPLDTLLDNSAFVTYQSDQLDIWPENTRDRVGEYYLSWADRPRKNSLPNPYGLAGISLTPTPTEIDTALNPSGLAEDAVFRAGLHLFRDKCYKCHSINTVGGYLGPDLNVPRSITEYREKAFVRSFVANPQSYRYNSKMTGVSLSEASFDSLYYYLEQMAEHKVDL